MERVIDLHLSFMDWLKREEEVQEELAREGIYILPGFAEQAELGRRYYNTFYSKPGHRLVLCGINPGQYGAGKTGVPFIDFDGISRLMPGVDMHGRKPEQERAAQFMLSVMEAYEAGGFQDAVYLTNISWYGFMRNGRNLNYYNIPGSVRHHFIDSFLAEMAIVRPSAIVPLSGEVQRTLRQLADAGKLEYPLAESLPHPLHSSFPSNVSKCRARYHACIEHFTGLRPKRDKASSEQPV
ncbi:uracil-DNA glycosylase family protein [Sporosarcina koreensis]|uniref:uracil-DNA glycosylase family protein n=1 Tax=Sporosarcina koreensis TaxID=334735 RepID=UPI000694D05A|nr:uracil-DNA glycosylase family protein [Sporosarcina koreensis]